MVSVSRTRRAQALGYHLQQLVADRMAERVVDMLEVVEVEDVRGHHLARAWRGQGLLQPLVQQHAVGQPGERVVQRQVARPVGQVQDMADVLAERAPVERLEQERGGSRRQCAFERAAALVAGQHDDGDVLERGVAAHALDEVEAIEVRHLEIDDGEIEHRRLQVRQRLETVLGLDHVGELGNLSRDDRARERVVVHDQDRWPSHCSPERFRSAQSTARHRVRSSGTTVAGEGKRARKNSAGASERSSRHS